ncbi:tRNA (Uracil-O(2)-)-methyltransferase [Pleurostoma richardsiae]|uniref:tRNA (uracil-O(2)-)-methyltransferase n=1 Tax=Pleurostoma richardsiae TaxID=41990 RepID=A0AA38VVJ6_9PEZI|nr:tRNA (Uracil-O(2)-)-methyltransferase [Pleurostoma richardsiae]
MAFIPTAFGRDAAPVIVDDGGGNAWSPVLQHDCSFDSSIFTKVMLNLIKNPNINSSWLFRADILTDRVVGGDLSVDVSHDDEPSNPPLFRGFKCDRLIVRRMIPRNTLRDAPLDQTCLLYRGLNEPGDIRKTLVVYLPHVNSESEMPFYHPVVRGIGFLHEQDTCSPRRSVSIHYCYFNNENIVSQKLTRTALNLLGVLHKHGEGQHAGYVKRVQHDVLVSQDVLQDRYTALKQKYGRALVNGWLETTDPAKHVFEDLCIAAFLIELWADMYKGASFPGFVDIGCGNGLLVYILNQEGYKGWGFDARTRKSWSHYSTTGEDSLPSLRQLVLLPSVVSRGPPHNDDHLDLSEDGTHDGLFPRGTFIISNHADELTPWTPILARLSECPFMMIPCCSHNLTGARFRAPPPKDKSASKSTYCSLVSFVTDIASDCGWQVEKEMLRIPSTRNTALIGRRQLDTPPVDIETILSKYGGTQGYFENVVKLLKSAPRGH